jgi:calcineurin-like phosphoesterase family protein
MKRWLASDLHLNHLNILQYCPARRVSDNGEKPTQNDVDLMNELIIKNWNDIVSPGDEVYITGDVAMGAIAKAPALIRRLNGNKTLILGNHDKSLKRIPELPELFVNVCSYLEKTFSVDGVKTMLCMSHFPMMHWNGQSYGSMMIHGHLHGSFCGVPGRIKDVGIDTNNLRPYNLDEVVRELRKVEIRGSHHAD